MVTMKLLIIEDNQLIARALESNLKDFYSIEISYEGMAGLNLARTSSYSVILLDLNLPDINGEEICRILRKEGIDTPIIVVSGNDQVIDKINLLDMGADDYVTKPFNIHELRTRINLAMRHASKNNRSGKLIVDDLILDPASHTVTRQGQLIALRRKEFDVLEYLMLNKGQTLTRIMIMEHIWDANENLWANVVDVHIKHLRDRVDRPFRSRLIKTVHGLGYKIESNNDINPMAKKKGGTHD